MNYTVLSAVVEELALLLPGAAVERVLGSAGNSMLLELHQRRKRLYLLLAPDRSLPRLHLLSAKPATTPLSHAFPLFLKSRVAGGRILSVRLLNRDRIVEMVFHRRDAEFRLVFELFGSASNLLLTDEAGVILALFYPVPASGTGARLLLPGIHYEVPPTRAQPGQVEKPSGIQVSGTETEANRSAELEFGQVLSERRFADATARLGKVLRKAQERTGRKRDSLVIDLARSDQAEKHRQAGDLILANLEQLRPGMSEAELTGHDGTTRLVPFDRKRTPIQNAEQYFRRYKKAKAGRSIISGRLREAEEALVFLAGLRSRIENASDEADLIGIESWLVKNGYAKPSSPERRVHAVKPLPASVPVRRIQFGEWEIVVGKNASGNDYISTKLALPSDLWFHADGIAGSHVLIRNPERREVPSEVVVKAASLAAYYSKGRSAGKVPVTFALSRNVKKPKGAKAGMVTVFGRRTIMAVPCNE